MSRAQGWGSCGAAKAGVAACCTSWAMMMLGCASMMEPMSECPLRGYPTNRMKVRTLEKSGVSTTGFVGAAAFDSILCTKRRQKKED